MEELAKQLSVPVSLVPMLPILMGLYVFALAAIIGYMVISRVPPLLHTPLMSATNAISAISLVASRRGVALLPASAENFLPWSVVSRPIEGDGPTINLVVGYHKANTSPILKTFLSRIDKMIAAVGQAGHRGRGPAE